MSKRFTDTEKWKKRFFRGLQAPYKLVWLYLLDECNHAGVWDVEFDVLKIRTGIGCNEEEILRVFKGKITPFDKKEKWFLEDFIEFQYGKLNPENRAHKSVIDLLAKYKSKGLTRGLQDPMDKDMDKDMDKEDEVKFIPPELSDVKEYFKERGYTEDSAERAFNHYKTLDWHDKKGTPVKNWKNKMGNNWMKEENKIERIIPTIG